MFFNTVGTHGLDKRINPRLKDRNLMRWIQAMGLMFSALHVLIVRL